MILIALASGVLSGLVWFGLQYVTVIPLIEAAERYEAARGDAHQHAEAAETGRGWKRNSLTGVATVLISIGFASVLVGLAFLGEWRLDTRRGALLGLAAFACVGLAPALGLPPEPPGVAAAELGARQIWWVAAVLATAAGLYLICGRSRSWLLRLGGVVCLVVPHAVGAPVATGETIVPASLVHEFVAASLATSGLHWLMLGAVAGFLYNRCQTAGGEPQSR